MDSLVQMSIMQRKDNIEMIPRDLTGQRARVLSIDFMLHLV